MIVNSLLLACCRTIHLFPRERKKPDDRRSQLTWTRQVLKTWEYKSIVAALLTHFMPHTVCIHIYIYYMVASINGGNPKSSILIGCSIPNHPFGDTSVYGNTHVCVYIYIYIRIYSIIQYIYSTCENMLSLKNAIHNYHSVSTCINLSYNCSILW